jgi:hypothetical protein
MSDISFSIIIFLLFKNRIGEGNKIRVKLFHASHAILLGLIAISAKRFIQ